MLGVTNGCFPLSVIHVTLYIRVHTYLKKPIYCTNKCMDCRLLNKKKINKKVVYFQISPLDLFYIKNY